MLTKITTNEIMLMLFLLAGLIISFWLNQVFICFGFATVLLSSGTFFWLKEHSTSRIIIRLNKFIQIAFLTVIILLLIMWILKLALSMILGNIWGMMILESGSSDLVKLVMISLGCIAVVTTLLNIKYRNSQSLK